MQVNARRLLRSACVGVFALVLAIGIVAYTAKAANYTANLSTAVNWTATAIAQPSAIWNCAPTTAAGDTCGVYPGQLALGTAGIIDSAVVTSSGGTGPLSVSTLIPNPIHLTINGGTVDVTSGGQLTLTGASQLVWLTGNPILSISGGTLTNNGTLALTATGQPLAINLSGGTFDGTGTTSISGSASFTMSGTQGPMTINAQTISNSSAGVLNFIAGNTLTMGNGANMTNGTGGTFNANGTGTIAQGAGAALITNQGNLFKSIGANFTIGVPFVNTGTAATSSIGVGMSFTGGSGGAGHNTPANWNLGGTGNTMNFGGAHVFNGAETFVGTGTITVNGGGTWTLNTSPTLSTGLNLANNGTINFSGTPARIVTIAGGTYSQTGTFSPRLGVGGTFGGGSDALTASGAATLGGTLAPVLVAGYVPTTGDLFTVMTCTGGCAGTPAYTPLVYPGGSFQLTNTGTQLQLLAVAVPPDLTVTNPFAAPASANAGSTVTFSTTLGNAGGAASSVSFTFTLTGGGTITGGTAAGFTCTPAGATMTCTSTGAFAGGASSVFTITTTAPNQAGAMTLSGTATPTPADANTANNSGAATVTINALTDITVTKTGPASVVAGQNVSYTVTVQNLGPSDAQNVTINDAPGAGLTFVSNTAPCAGGYPCTIPTITSGSSVTFTSTWALAANATGSASNTVSVTTTTPESSITNNSSTASSTITTSADVAVTKTGPASVAAGQSVTYAITITNNGPSDATSISVTDPTPANLTFNSATGACTAFPCTIASLAAGGSAVITATYTVSATASGTITNAVTATASTTDPVPGNNTAATTATVVPAADVSITKTAPTTVVAGSSIIFNIIVSNLGPSTATNIVVDDVAGSSLTFISATGACTSFPCTIASLANGTSATISATYKVAANATSVTNTAKILSTSTFDPNSTNNSATVTRAVKSPCASAPPTLLAPADGQVNVPVSGMMQWSNVGATFYDVYLGPAGTGCNTLVGTTNVATTFGYAGLQPDTDYEARVVARESGCATLSSTCIHFHTAAGTPACNLAPPTLLSPANGALISSPLTLQWSAVTGATSYHVVATVNGSAAIDTVTPDTSLVINVDNGPIGWSVTALSGNCASVPSAGTFNVCTGPGRPLAGVVGAPSSGRTYEVLVVDPLPTTTKYDYQEATKSDFSDAITQTTTSASVSYTHTTGASAIVYFYRVRAYNVCTPNPGPFSKTLRVVIVPEKISERPVLNVPVGTKSLVVEHVFIPGEDQPVSFTATADKPWIVKIDPNAGTLPPSGKTLDVTIDPSQLPNGTFTATVLVTTTPLLDTKRATNGTNPKASPVTINLVTPVVPVDPTAPTSESLIIPAVGHLIGINSQWRSDVRVFNSSPQKLKYILNFLSPTSTDVKETTIETDSGATTALDDIIHNWYGFGEVGDNASGVLEIRPLVPSGDAQSALATIVSSRTYNLSDVGTLGQFIPAVPFTSFIGGGTRLSLQQIAQNQNFRTNFGLVEATGHPASVLLSMFTSGGAKLFDLPVSLGGSEQKQLNGLLAQQGIDALSDGRMEVKVTDGDGKITAYASVVDNDSLDPLFVPGKPLDGSSAGRYIVPGVADLNNGLASWRSDVRIFNSGDTAQTATLTFYPEGEGKTPMTASTTIVPGEVKVLDNLLQSVFSTHDVGGAMHVDTPGGSKLVVTARTYNQTASGTLGQFIPAATPNDAIDRTAHALNILQVEDSVRYRTNVGLAEVTGKPATVEISVVQPDTKITPTIQVPLAANEFLQFPLSAFGLGNVYNVRVSVKVVDGDGRVTAYGSVIDQATTAPTYVAAQ